MSDRTLLINVVVETKGVEKTVPYGIKNGIILSSGEVDKVLDKEFNEDGELWIDWSPI